MSNQELVEAVLELIEIPPSYYQKAAARHTSLGDWLCRDESSISHAQPHVSPQGSFRLGTVIRPIDPNEAYDLDNVTTMSIAKDALSQREIKAIYGREIGLYAKAHSMSEAPEEKHRCWRLNYADEASFHLDTLPCVPEAPEVVARLVANGVPLSLAAKSIAITDTRHPHFSRRSTELLSSNPRGFADWFEQRARPFAEGRIRSLAAKGAYASVDEVPPYEWKTPLQRVIQLLKRHRDVMFRDFPDLKPISMIITNLASRAYEGQTDVIAALVAVADGMGRHVNRVFPRVPNPADPFEDYADKWRGVPALEENFWRWLEQLKADMKWLEVGAGVALRKRVETAFDVELSSLGNEAAAPAFIAPAAAVHIREAPRPWASREAKAPF